MDRNNQTVPVYDRMVAPKSGDLSNIWANWFTSTHRNVEHLNSVANDNFIVNPDFHWSRTKGNTPTVADGLFVEEWFVKANGMTFSITPTFYTSTTNSSKTGSQRYAHVAITAVNANEFEIYEQYSNEISKYQEKQLTFTLIAYNNNATAVKAKFYVGFDTNNDGTDEFSTESRSFTITNKLKSYVVNMETATVQADNQNNKINVKLLLYDLGSAVNLNLYAMKGEFATDATPLFVNHTLEKVIIDNI